MYESQDSEMVIIAERSGYDYRLCLSVSLAASQKLLKWPLLCKDGRVCVCVCICVCLQGFVPFTGCFISTLFSLLFRSVLCSQTFD